MTGPETEPCDHEEACPVCGCEARGQGGYLQCECPAPDPVPNPLVGDEVEALDDLVSRAEVLRVIRSLGNQDADLALYGAADNARAREYGEAAAIRACCAIALMPSATTAKLTSETRGCAQKTRPSAMIDEKGQTPMERHYADRAAAYAPDSAMARRLADMSAAYFRERREPDSMFMTEAMREKLKDSLRHMLVADMPFDGMRYDGMNIYAHPAGTVVVDHRTGQRGIISEHVVIAAVRADVTIEEPRHDLR